MDYILAKRAISWPVRSLSDTNSWYKQLCIWFDGKEYRPVHLHHHTFVSIETTVRGPNHTPVLQDLIVHVPLQNASNLQGCAVLVVMQSGMSLFG